jgi:hypothetical protein
MFQTTKQIISGRISSIMEYGIIIGYY